jgi:hypothetical protein
MTIMQAHCERLFNNKKPVSTDALNLIDQQDTETKIDETIIWKEFTKAIKGRKRNTSQSIQSHEQRKQTPGVQLHQLILEQHIRLPRMAHRMRRPSTKSIEPNQP